MNTRAEIRLGNKKAAYRQWRGYTEGLVSQAEARIVQARTGASSAVQTEGGAKPTRREKTQALHETLRVRLGQQPTIDAELLIQPTAVPVVKEPVTTRKRVAEAATMAREKAREMLAESHLGHAAIADFTSRIASLVIPNNTILRSHLARLDHEAAYGVAPKMGRLRKGFMHALEIVPIIGDGINGLGALVGRHNLAGRKLDGRGRFLEALGLVPAINASLLHDTRIRTERRVLKKLETRAAKAAAEPSRRKAA